VFILHWVSCPNRIFYNFKYNALKLNCFGGNEFWYINERWGSLTLDHYVRYMRMMADRVQKTKTKRHLERRIVLSNIMLYINMGDWCEWYYFRTFCGCGTRFRCMKWVWKLVSISDSMIIYVTFIRFELSWMRFLFFFLVAMITNYDIRFWWE